VLIDGLCKNGQFSAAIELVGEMKNKGVACSVVIYGALMDALCVSLGNLRKQQKSSLISDLRGLQPACIAYNIMVKGCCKNGLMNESIEWLRGMEKNGCPPYGCTYNTILRGFMLNNGISTALYCRDMVVSQEFGS